MCDVQESLLGGWDMCVTGQLSEIAMVPREMHERGGWVMLHRIFQRVAACE